MSDRRATRPQRHHVHPMGGGPRTASDTGPGAVPAGWPSLESAFEVTAVGMAFVGPDGTFVAVNPALCALLGRPREELVGHAPAEFTHPDDQALSTQICDQARAGTPVTDHSRKRYLRPDGTVVHALRTTSTVWDASGQALGLLTQVVDVSETVEAEQRVANSEARFRAVVSGLWDAISLHDTEGVYSYVSPAITALTGHDPSDLIGVNAFAHVHPDDIELLRTAFERVIHGTDRGVPMQYRFRCKDGTWRWLESLGSNRLNDPAVGAILVTSRDATMRQRRAAQQEAVAALGARALGGASLAALGELAVDLVAKALEVELCELHRLGPDGDLELAAEHVPLRRRRNGASRPLFGSARPPRPVTSHPEVAAWLASEALASQGSVIFGVGAPSSVDGPRHPEWPAGASTVIQVSGTLWGALVVASQRPDSLSAQDRAFLEAVGHVLAASLEREHDRRELERSALTDALTGLPNATSARDRLGQEIRHLRRRPGSVALLFIDTDNFKLINDTLGHLAGDRLVVEVSRRLVDAVRGEDTVARFGGDEFIVVCADTTVDDAVIIARRIRQVLSEPVVCGVQPVSVTASVGIAVTCEPDATAEDLLAQADTAMYEAKRAGKDRCSVFDESMRRQVAERFELDSSLRRAVAEQELEVFYQPIVAVGDGSLRGAEALVRWRHPTRGLLGPYTFIPYAEESGLILAIGQYVLDDACDRIAEWGNLSVSVNVSGRQLSEPGFTQVVAAALARTGIPPRRLRLEITESAVVSDLAGAVEVIRAVRDLGVGVGMDDFGTGYSSLSYLSELPLDFIKVDRSFIARVAEDERSASLLNAIAALCGALDLWAIAEGVETAEQLQRVKDVGIEYAQGWLFGRPAPAAELRQP